MKARQLIIGEKYTPISKSIICDLSESIAWKEAIAHKQNFLYYKGRNDNYYCFSYDVPTRTSVKADFFLPEDVIPYVEINENIIGYKLIKPEYEKVAMRVLNLSNKTAYVPFIMREMLLYYVPKIKELGIIDWFEPIYEELKEQRLILGSKNDVIIIKSGTSDITLINGQYTNINIINAVLNDYFSLIDEFRVIGDKWKTSIDQNVKFIRVGCKDENHLFSISELKLIVETYNSLNY